MNTATKQTVFSKYLVIVFIQSCAMCMHCIHAVEIVTFFNNNFVNCKAISNYGYQKYKKMPKPAKLEPE